MYIWWIRTVNSFKVTRTAMKDQAQRNLTALSLSGSKGAARSDPQILCAEESTWGQSLWSHIHRNGCGYLSEVIQKNYFTQDPNQTPETEKPVYSFQTCPLLFTIRLNLSPNIQDMVIVSHPLREVDFKGREKVPLNLYFIRDSEAGKRNKLHSSSSQDINIFTCSIFIILNYYIQTHPASGKKWFGRS